jgi:hypothetical protein
VNLARWRSPKRVYDLKSGDLFAVPLQDGSWGCIRLDRCDTSDAQTPVGPNYYFGLLKRRYASVPTLAAVLDDDEFTVIICSDYPERLPKEWRYIGRRTALRIRAPWFSYAFPTAENGCVWFAEKRGFGRKLLGRSVPQSLGRMEPFAVYGSEAIAHRLSERAIPPSTAQFCASCYGDREIPGPEAPASWLDNPGYGGELMAVPPVTKQQAVETVREWLASYPVTGDARFVTTGVREYPNAYMVYFNDQRYVETGDSSHALYGNSPHVVDKRDGLVTLTGTHVSDLDAWMEEYELARSLLDGPAPSPLARLRERGRG